VCLGASEESNPELEVVTALKGTIPFPDDKV
jgi:hypothetical protein